MKRVALFVVMIIVSAAVHAQDAQKITGIWWNNEKTSKIEIQQKNGEFVGTVIYIAPEKYANGEPEKDNKNPNEQLRTRSRLGIQILSGLKYNTSEKQWISGRIYDPTNGKTYDCYAWFDGNGNVLNIKGYVAGIKWLGRSTTWARTTK
jgi:Uncharacterized protein conserved in bacteria